EQPNSKKRGGEAREFPRGQRLTEEQHRERGGDRETQAENWRDQADRPGFQTARKVDERDKDKQPRPAAPQHVALQLERAGDEPVEHDGRSEAPRLRHQEMMRLDANRGAAFVNQVRQTQTDHRAEREPDALGHLIGAVARRQRVTPHIRICKVASPGPLEKATEAWTMVRSSTTSGNRRARSIYRPPTQLGTSTSLKGASHVTQNHFHSG